MAGPLSPRAHQSPGDDHARTGTGGRNDFKNGRRTKADPGGLEGLARHGRPSQGPLKDIPLPPHTPGTNER